MIEIIDVGNIDGFFVRTVYEDGELIGYNQSMMVEDSE